MRQMWSFTFRLACRMMMVRASQLLPHTRFSDAEAGARMNLAADAEERLSFATVAGATLEVTLAQFWSSLGPGRLRAEVSVSSFRLCQTSSNSLQ